MCTVLTSRLGVQGRPDETGCDGFGRYKFRHSSAKQAWLIAAVGGQTQSWPAQQFWGSGSIIVPHAIVPDVGGGDHSQVVIGLQSSGGTGFGLWGPQSGFGAQVATTVWLQ